MLEIPFQIQKHPWFLCTNQALQTAMKNSREAGANKGRQKVDGLTYEDEIKILGYPFYLPKCLHSVEK